MNIRFFRPKVIKIFWQIGDIYDFSPMTSPPKSGVLATIPLPPLPCPISPPCNDANILPHRFIVEAQVYFDMRTNVIYRWKQESTTLRAHSSCFFCCPFFCCSWPIGRNTGTLQGPQDPRNSKNKNSKRAEVKLLSCNVTRREIAI